jgi:hypothetical protein
VSIKGTLALAAQIVFLAVLSALTLGGLVDEIARLIQ